MDGATLLAMPRPLFVCLLALSLVGPLRAQDTVFVSPRGNDQLWGRTRTTAVRTLERARDLVRGRRAAGTRWRGAVVFLLPGDHVRTTTFRLEAQDGGTATYPVTYAGAPGGASRILGAVRVGLGPVSDTAVLARLPAVARGPARRVVLERSTGGGNGRRVPLPELFDETGPLRLARWPVTGWSATVGTTLDPIGGAVTLDPAPGWTPARGMFFTGYFYWDWAWSYAPVVGAVAGSTGLAGGECCGYGWRSRQRVAIVNAAEQVDRVGSYFVDLPGRSAYVWPRAAADTLWLGVLDAPLVVLDRVSGLRLDRLVLGRTGGTAIEGRGGSDVSFDRLRIEWTGGEGITMLDGTRIRVTRSRFEGTGGTALQVGGGDRPSLTPSGIVVEDNLISGAGRLRPTDRSVVLRGVAVRFAHNEVADGDMDGLLIYGNDHRILDNNLHHLDRASQDVGAIYMLRNWTERGTVIARNWIHDIGGLPIPETYLVNGLYLDDGESGVGVQDNVFSGLPTGVFIHGGHDNAVQGNLFLCAAQAVYLARIGPWAGYAEELRARLDSVPVDRPPYSRYPGLSRLAREEPWTPVGNRAEDNTVVGGALVRRHNILPFQLDLARNEVIETPCATSPTEAQVREAVRRAQERQGRPRIAIDSVGPRAVPGP